MRVLVIHDEPEARRRLWQCLAAAGHEVRDVLDRTEATARPRVAAEVYVVGVGAHDAAFIRALRGRGLDDGPAVIAVVPASCSARLPLYEAGADHVITGERDELLGAMRSAERAWRRAQALREQLTVDGLTRALTRAAATAALEAELARAGRTPMPVSIFLADLDHFKQVNDRWGHSTGDQVLARAASQLRMGLRPYDILGRWGGEEFLVVLPGCTAATAAKVAERVRDNVARPLADVDGPEQVTMSIGAVTVPPPIHANAAALILAADEALYAAKEHGRNRVEWGVVN